MAILKNRKKGAGFTLIEILVVISIIALISSAAIYYINDAREKGRIAALLQFSGGIKATLANSPVAYWSLDNGGGDSWGQSHGTNFGAISINGVVGKALSFDGNDVISVPVYGNLTNNFVSANSWTFEAWIKPNLQGNDYQDIFEGVYHMPRIAIIRPTRSLLLAGFAPSYKNLAIKDDVITNKWQHIVVVAKIINSSTANYKLYHDGKKVFDNTNSRISGVLIGDYKIGGRSGEYFNGLIDEVKIYGEALPFAQIESHYAEGAEKFLAQAVPKKEKE